MSRVMFAYGDQRNTAFLSLPGEGCAYIPDWPSFTAFLRDDLQGHITRWDGAVDDFSGVYTVDRAVALYIEGGFNQGGRNPNPKQHGNWITPDSLGRTFEVGSRAVKMANSSAFILKKSAERIPAKKF